MAIDVGTLEIRATATVHNRVVKAMKLRDANVFIASTTNSDCRLEHGIEIAKLSSDLKPETLFTYQGVNDIELWDFEPLQSAFIMSGSVRVQLPSTLLREIIPHDKLLDPFDPALWERGEEPGNGFVLIGSSNGTVLGDRVFHDRLNRSINRIVTNGPTEIVGVGAALGDRGWMLTLENHALDVQRIPAFPTEMPH